MEKIMTIVLAILLASAQGVFAGQREILNQNVKDEQGQELGKVVDLLVGHEGRIRFFVLCRGGLDSEEERLIPIPWYILSFATRAEDGTLIMGLSQEILQDAPSYNKTSRPNFADPQWQEVVNSFYKKKSQFRKK